jgi:hypothetical protein
VSSLSDGEKIIVVAWCQGWDMLYPGISNTEILARSKELEHIVLGKTGYFEYYTRFKLYEGYTPDRTFEERSQRRTPHPEEKGEEEEKEPHNPCIDKTKVVKGVELFDQIVMNAVKNKLPSSDLDTVMALYNIIPANIMTTEFIRVVDVLNLDPNKKAKSPAPLTNNQKKQRAVEKTLKEFDKVCLSLM